MKCMEINHVKMIITVINYPDEKLWFTVTGLLTIYYNIFDWYRKQYSTLYKNVSELFDFLISNYACMIED